MCVFPYTTTTTTRAETGRQEESDSGTMYKWLLRSLDDGGERGVKL